MRSGRTYISGAVLLRMLMTIGSLGTERKDPSKIPVKEIIEEWRAQASRNRYEGPMWTAAALDVRQRRPSRRCHRPMRRRRRRRRRPHTISLTRRLFRSAVIIVTGKYHC